MRVTSELSSRTAASGISMKSGLGLVRSAKVTPRPALHLLHSAPEDGVEGVGQDPGEGRRTRLEGKSSGLRVAPSSGDHGSNGIRGCRRACTRLSTVIGSEAPGVRCRGDGMLSVGIDIASETHTVAVVDERGAPLVQPTAFGEDAAGLYPAAHAGGAPRGRAGRHGGDWPLLAESLPRAGGPGLRGGPGESRCARIGSSARSSAGEDRCPRRGGLGPLRGAEGVTRLADPAT